jgi:hypothetical protein
MVEGVKSTVIYLIYFKNFCEYHNVPLPSTTTKFKKENYNIYVYIYVHIYILSHKNTLFMFTKINWYLVCYEMRNWRTGIWEIHKYFMV